MVVWLKRILFVWVFLVVVGLGAGVVEAQLEPIEAPVSVKAIPKEKREDAHPRIGEIRGRPDPPSAGGLLLRTTGALLLVLGIIGALSWGLRRYAGDRFGVVKQLEAPDLAVLSSISIGERRTLTAVRFGDRMLLLGATAQSITLLADEEIRQPKIVRGRSVADLLEDKELPNFRQALAGG